MELGPQDYLQLVRDAKKAVEIPASLATDDTVSSEISNSSNAAGSAIAIAAAINKVVGETGVRATAVGAEINATKTVVGATSIQTDLYVNGTQINLSLTSGQTESARRQYVMNSINKSPTASPPVPSVYWAAKCPSMTARFILPRC